MEKCGGVATRKYKHESVFFSAQRVMILIAHDVSVIKSTRRYVMQHLADRTAFLSVCLLVTDVDLADDMILWPYV